MRLKRPLSEGASCDSQVFEKALESGCKSISYTYNEPTIFLEYVLDCARLARKKGLKNVMVSNGYIKPEPLKDALKVIDAVNIDLKEFNEKFYEDIADAELKPVLDALKLMKGKLWLELTNLITSGKNDNMKEIEKRCKWIAEELGKDTPMHFSMFFPMYKMMDIDPTPEETLAKAKKIAEKYLDYVYVGNVDGESNTYCRKCSNFLIRRHHYSLEYSGRKCSCGFEIARVF